VYVYWILQTKIPVTKIQEIGNYLKSYYSFAGMNIVNDTFRSGLATVKIRVRTIKGTSPKLLFDLGLGGTLYHTPENIDSWEMAHKPANYKLKRVRSQFTINLQTMAQKGVIVFGKDTEYDIIEIMQVRDSLVKLGYAKANFLKAIRDTPGQSLTQKVASWALLSRFCVMIDRKPAGHLAEFPIVKKVGAVLAVLNPQGHRSSFMLDFDPSIKHVKRFEFKKSPVEVLARVVSWAEKIITDRESYFQKTYTWRNEWERLKTL
jgi:hypothetical protein